MRMIGKDTNASLKDRNLLANSVGQLNAPNVIDGSVAVVEWLSIDVYQPLSDVLKIMSTTALSFCSPQQEVAWPCNSSKTEGRKKGCMYVCVCCLLYTSPSPRDRQKSRMPSSA